MIKITSFNMNGIRSSYKKGFFDWFETSNIDFLCLQETRVWLNQIKENKQFFPKNYYYEFSESNKKGYSGVAIYAKKKPQNIIKNIGIYEFDIEGRYIEFQYNNLNIVSIYFPSGSSKIKRQNFKILFLKKYIDILKNTPRFKNPTIICGDINIVHKPIDIHNWKKNFNKTSGVLLEEQYLLDILINNLGFVDSFRTINPNKYQYTWWSMKNKQCRKKNLGWRIDYHFTTQCLKNKIIPNSDEIYKKHIFSDHAPITIKYNINIE